LALTAPFEAMDDAAMTAVAAAFNDMVTGLILNFNLLQTLTADRSQ
jgi:hypothetical protein